jgi:hypothetical protein
VNGLRTSSLLMRYRRRPCSFQHSSVVIRCRLRPVRCSVRSCFWVAVFVSLMCCKLCPCYYVRLRLCLCVADRRFCFVAAFVPVAGWPTSSFLLRCRLRSCCCVAAFVPINELKRSTLLMRCSCGGLGMKYQKLHTHNGMCTQHCYAYLWKSLAGH